MVRREKNLEIIQPIKKKWKNLKVFTILCMQTGVGGSVGEIIFKTRTTISAGGWLALIYITALILRNEKCQGNGRRSFFGLLFTWHFIYLDNILGLSDNPLALSWKGDTSYFLPLRSCQSKPDNVRLYIMWAQNAPVPHSVPLISSSDLISAGFRARQLSTFTRLVKAQ